MTKFFKKNKKSNNSKFTTDNLLALEPRIVFDGAMAVAAAETLSVPDDNSQADNTSDVNAVSLSDNDLIDGSAENQNIALVFIDMRLDEAQELANGVDPDAHVIWLDPAKEGIGQIGQALESYGTVSSVHIFTHAEDGELNLGSTLITAETLVDNAQGLSAWSESLTAEADILFYGCNFAETSQGQNLLSEIANLTSADIAASTDLTGAEVLGGDWDLEHSTGVIEAAVIIDEATQVSYAHTLDAQPRTIISGVDDPLIGETMTFTVSFDNQLGTDTGFAPYINLLVPFMGADGVYDAGSDTYTDTPDGISFTSASFLGQAVETFEVTLNDIDGGSPGIQVEHPLAQNPDGTPLVLTIEDSLGFKEGDKLIVLQLPFGSFTVGQPAADILVTAQLSNLADVGTPLPIASNGGFQLGDADALDNFDVDPPVQAASLNAGNSSTATATPQIVTINSSFSGGEGETATGENFEVGHTVGVDVAGGQTLDNVTIDYIYSEDTIYTSAVASGGSLSTAPLQNASGNTADDTITATYTTLSGSQNTDFNFYVGEFDQAGANVLDDTSGASKLITRANNIVVNGTWNPIDVRDSAVAIAATQTAQNFTAKSIATQKSVSNLTDGAATPDDVLEYTINFQISDYFAFNTIIFEDIFSDGQNLNATPITLDVTHQGSAIAQQTFTLGTDYTLTENTGTDYSETLDFDASALLISSPFGSGILEGGKFAGDNFTATTGQIQFQTVIQDQYADPALAATNDEFVKSGDDLGNVVSITGRNLNDALAAFAGPQFVSDGSSAGVTVPTEELNVSVYAINGSTAGGLDSVNPGDDVTFRLEYDLATSDFEDFLIESFLPLPIFSADDNNADGTGGDGFTEDTINSIPIVGQFRFGPTVSAYVDANVSLTGAATVNTAGNAVNFNLGDLDDPANASGKIDILFTVKTSAEPFADGLFLTLLAQQSDENTAGTPSLSTSSTRVQLQEPSITNVIKGVVATNVAGGSTYTPTFSNGTPSGIKAAGNTDANPLSTTINSTNLSTLNLDNDVSDVDAGDLVRFAIVVENIGTSDNGVYDLTISEDAIPTGYAIPGGGINLRAVNGAGTALAIETGTPETNLFTAGGIRFADTATGSLEVADATNGRNIAIITYDLEVSNAAEIAETITSEARVTNYANVEGGTDFTAVDLKDDASVTIPEATITKTLVGDVTDGTPKDVVIGEVVTYQTVITIPEGTSNLATFSDTLDTGLAFLDATNVTITPSAGISLGASTITFASPGGTPEDTSRRMNIDFGTITNTNDDNSTPDTITITYDAVVLDTVANNAGDTFGNSARYTSDNEGNKTASVDDLIIREPAVTVTVTPDSTEADASDTITWTVVVTAASGTSADAHEINLSNTIPSGLTFVGSSITNISGVAPTTPLAFSGGDITGAYATLMPGETSTFTYQTTVDPSVSLGQAITNEVDLDWSSLTGIANNDIAGGQSTFDKERDDTSATPNTYEASGDGDVTILFNPPTLVVDETSEASNGGDATIGEIVRYRFVVRVPESTTPDFRVEPEIPTGMQFLDDGSATIAFVSNGGLTSDSGTLTGGALAISGNEGTVATDEPTFTLAAANINAGANGSGDNPQFLLGEITNTDSDANQEFIIIEYNAIVLNETGVDNGDALTSDAGVLSNTTVLTSSATVDVDVVEPELTNLVKQVINTDGTTATFEITFENMSGTDAFNVNVADSLPTNLTNLANVTITPAGGTVLDTDNSTGTALDIDLTTMPDGGSITITYTADIVDDSLVVADTDADVTWTSLPGATTTLAGSTSGVAGGADGERTGSGVGENDYTISEGAGLNVISGTLFEDINQDGVIDGTDPKLANTQINIIYLGEDDAVGGGDDVSLTTQTDINGNYSLGALPSGNYRIDVQDTGVNGLPANFLSINDATGSPTDNLIELTLGEGVTNTTANFGVLSPNSAPSFTNLGGGSPDVTHTEGGAATVLDADAILADPELGTNALDDWDGSTLTLVRNGGANVLDTFVGTGTLGTLTESGNIVLGGATVGTVTTNSGGTLVLTFGNNATTVQVNSVLNQIGYSFSGDAPPATPITINYTVNDGNTANAQGSGAALTATSSVSVQVNNVNDLPTSTDNTISLVEDNNHSFVVADFAFADADNPDSFQQLRIDTLPSNGTLTLGGTPVTIGQIIPVGSITTLLYAPDTNLNGNSADSFTFSVGDNFGGFDAIPNTIDFDISAVNDAPSFGMLGGANPDVTHIEGGAATVLDPNATLIDPELNAANNWDGATLGIIRDGGANADDVFVNSGTLGVLSEGGNLVVGGTTIGAVTTNSNGVLLLTFNGNATNTLVNNAMQQIAYEFAGDVPPLGVVLAYTVNDGNVTGQGTGGALSDNTGRINVEITATNDAPNGADNTLNLNEDEPYTFMVADFGFSDPDVVDVLTNVRIDTLPLNGELQLNGVAVTAGQIIPVGNIPNLVFVAVENESANNYGNFTFSVGDQSGLPNAFDPTPNTMTINVAPISDGPIIDAPLVSTLPGDSVPVLIDVSLFDTDGSETLDNTVTIDNIPNGVQVFGPGGTPITVTAGSITLTLADLADLSFVPPQSLQGTFSLDITAGSNDGAAPLGTTVQTLTFEVLSPVQPPILPPSSGNVAGSGQSSAFSSFTGNATGAGSSSTDANGDGITDAYQRRDGEVTPNLNFENDTFRDIAKIDIYLTGDIDDQLMIITKDNTIKLPKNIFRHSDPNEKFTYKVEMADGTPIPSWIEFDEEELQFKGVPPLGTQQTLEFVIIAKDSKNNEAKARFKIIVTRDISEFEEIQKQDAAPEEAIQEETSSNDNVDEPQEEVRLDTNQERLPLEDQIAANTRISRYVQDQAFIDSLSS